MVPYILNWLYARYGPEYNLWFSLTILVFIDYIVSPTLTVISDSLDLILGTLDIPPNFDFLRGPKPPTLPCKEKIYIPPTIT